MSIETYVSYCYGVELVGLPPADKLVAFIREHDMDLDEELVALAESDPDGFFDLGGYEDPNGFPGVAAFLAEAVNRENVFYVSRLVDEYGYEFVGISAVYMFPWDDPGKVLDKRNVGLALGVFEKALGGYVRELYGDCPPFREHKIVEVG